MTAHTPDFWVQHPPNQIYLTNSIVAGKIVVGRIVTLAVSSELTQTFRTAGAGNYYLPDNSPHRHAGSAGISPRLATDLQEKISRHRSFYLGATQCTPI